MKDKKVIITGGAGFIGSHIARKLVELGAQVTIIDNLFAGKKEFIADILPKIRFVEGDIRDLDLLKTEFQGADFVSHQAALRSVPQSVADPVPYHDVNMTGHLRVLEAARDCGVKRVAFASSSSVYGDSEEFPQKETQFPKPISPYAITKLAGECYNRMFYELYDVEAVSLRYFNVFGPGQDPNGQYAVVIPKFITMMMQDKQPPIFGDGEQTRDFTYVENNVLSNIIAFQTKKKVGGEVINICAGEGVSVNQIVAYINEFLGKDIKPEYLPIRAGDVLHTRGDNTKSKKLLDFKISVDFKEGMRETIESFKNV